MKFFTKKNRAAKKWHSRAMIIDVSKTRITFINSTEFSDSQELSSGSPQVPNEPVSQPQSSDKSEYQPLF